MTTQPSIAVEENAEPGDVEFVLKNLQAFNLAQAGEKGYQSLAVLARGAEGEIVGGLLGDTNRKWMHVDILWVDEAHRGLETGRRLAAAAEEEAMRRGCVGAYLETFSFQAPGFYLKLGYAVFGELGEFEPGGAQYFLSKRFG